MRLNHIDLQVSNVDRTREFFEKHFGLRCTFQRRNELAILEDDAGLSFGISNLFGAVAPVYPPDFHVGFILEREQDVRAKYAELTAVGISMKADIAIGGPNLYFTCLAPDGIPVEVRAPRDQEKRRAP